VVPPVEKCETFGALETLFRFVIRHLKGTTMKRETYPVGFGKGLEVVLGHRVGHHAPVLV